MSAAKSIKELSDEELVANAKELKGMATLEKKYMAEIRERHDNGVELPNISIGAPSQQTRVKKKDDMIEVLEGFGLTEDQIAEVFHTIPVAGKIKFA